MLSIAASEKIADFFGQLAGVLAGVLADDGAWMMALLENICLKGSVFTR